MYCEKTVDIKIKCGIHPAENTSIFVKLFPDYFHFSLFRSTMLNLQNFEFAIDKRLLKRGLSYFENGQVTSLEKSEENAWLAEVEDTDVYEINVGMNSRGEIVSFSCNCPVNGNICKHVIAVFYALREGKTSAVNSAKSTTKNQFQSLLKSLTRDEYQAFILHYAAQHKDFKTSFELFFAEKIPDADIEKKYRQVVEKLIRKYSGSGFIYYRESKSLSAEVEKLLNTGMQQVVKKNFADAFKLVKAILHPVTETIGYSDDSGAYISDTIFSIIDFLGKISAATEAIGLKEEIFDFIVKELNNSLYFDYGDIGYPLVEIAETLSLQLSRENDLILFFDHQISSASKSDSDYFSGYFLERKVELLKQSGRVDEAEKLIRSNLDVVELRMEEVKKAIQIKNFTEAKRLIQDGIVNAEKKDHPGTVDHWKAELLRIAQLEKDVPSIRKYAKELCFSDHLMSVDHYRIWKSTFTAEEWTNVIESEIKRITARLEKQQKSKKHNSWAVRAEDYLDELAPIYIEEGYGDRLMELVEKANSLNTALQYHDHLFPVFAKRLVTHYIPLLRIDAENSNNRSGYAALAKAMAGIAKDIPQETGRITALADELIAKYSTNPRRPALVDEIKNRFQVEGKVVKINSR